MRFHKGEALASAVNDNDRNLVFARPAVLSAARVIRVWLDNREEKLRAGMAADVTFPNVVQA